MKKNYMLMSIRQSVAAAANKPLSKKLGLLSVMFLFGMAAFSQTNYYLRLDSLKKGAVVKAAPSSVRAWTTDPGGSSTAGTFPPDFVTPGQIFNFQSSGWSNAKHWTVSGAGSKIVVGVPDSIVTFTSSAASNISAIIDVAPTGTLVYEGARTDSLTWGTLATGSTVEFGGCTTAFQQVIPGNYYNLSLKAGGATYYPLVFSTGTINVAGTFTPRGSAIYGSTINFNGNGGQVIPAGAYHNLSISGTKSVPDTLRGTISVAGVFSNTSTGSPIMAYSINPTTGAVVTSTVAYNGFNTQPLTTQEYDNLAFTNGQTFYVSSYNYNAKTITLIATDPELQAGDSIVLAAKTTSNAYFGLDATTAITNVQDSVITLNNAPGIKLFVNHAAGGKDTLLITSFSVLDSTITLVSATAGNTPFVNGDTVYSQIITAPAYSKTTGLATTYYLAQNLTGNSFNLSAKKGFINFNNLGSISFGSATKLPSAKTITGIVTIDNTFTAGTGSVTTTGSTIIFDGLRQAVPGINYDKLVINEDSATTAALGGKSLVSTSLQIGSGKLATNATSKSLTLDNNATFTVGSDTSFVLGPLFKNFASATPFTYYIGAEVPGFGAYPTPVTIAPKTSDSKTYEASFNLGKVSNSTKVTSPIDAVDTLSYYNVVLSNYTAGVDTSAIVTFETLPVSTYLDSLVGIAHYFHGSFVLDATPITLSSLSSPLIETTLGYDTIFGHYTWATVNPNTVPVKFANVGAEALINATVKVNWESLTETNLSKYVIEGSTNGVQFSTKGTINVIGQTKYSFIDLAPNSGINYYRIKAIDKDGQLTYSSIVSATIANVAANKLSVYPNPVINKQLNVVLNTEASVYTLNLTNVLGQTVLSTSINHNGGSALYNIALPTSTPAGTYFIQLSDGNTQVTKTVVVE